MSPKTDEILGRLGKLQSQRQFPNLSNSMFVKQLVHNKLRMFSFLLLRTCTHSSWSVNAFFKIYIRNVVHVLNADVAIKTWERSLAHLAWSQNGVKNTLVTINYLFHSFDRKTTLSLRSTESFFLTLRIIKLRRERHFQQGRHVVRSKPSMLTEITKITANLKVGLCGVSHYTEESCVYEM